jgi:nucleoside-diphosphate-sugar epimerase
MRIAATGGLGRLGRYVVEALLPAHDVLAIDRVPPDGTLAGGVKKLTEEGQRGPKGDRTRP